MLQIKEQYEVEKDLARRLREASRQERRAAYVAAYDELFRRLPHHPALTRKADARAREKEVQAQIRLLRHFLRPKFTFLEIGAGDCSLSFEVARHVERVHAVDVSVEITRSATSPANFELSISDGCSIPVPPESIDLAYSNQLMEHLHPDDALEQLRNVWTALTSGNKYICLTPNRLAGPHDISEHFDDVATGLHLKEYTTTELVAIFRAAGFKEFEVYIAAGPVFLLLPVFPVLAVEAVLERLPHRLARGLARRLPLRLVLGQIVATKGGRAR